MYIVEIVVNALKDCIGRFSCAFSVQGKGVPDLSTRIMLRRLVSDLEVPALAFTDANSYGYEIYLTYKFGSLGFVYEAPEIAVPELIRIGVTADDIRDLIDAAPSFRLSRKSQQVVQHGHGNKSQSRSSSGSGPMAQKEMDLLHGILSDRPYFKPSSRWLSPRYAFWLHRRFRPSADNCFYCLGLCMHCERNFLRQHSSASNDDLMSAELLHAFSVMPDVDEVQESSVFSYKTWLSLHPCSKMHCDELTRKQEASYLAHNEALKQLVIEDIAHCKEELYKLLEYGKTAQIEGLLSLGHNFMTDSYLRAKIGRYVPQVLED